jgi:hypothetical protein
LPTFWATLPGIWSAFSSGIRSRQNASIIWQKTRERLRDRGIEPESPSLKYAIPILEAAADEENNELQDLWSRLLAAAMDPNRRDAMRQSFIATVKQMDLDVVVFKAIHENGSSGWNEAAHAVIGRTIKLSRRNHGLD